MFGFEHQFPKMSADLLLMCWQKHIEHVHFNLTLVSQHFFDGLLQVFALSEEERQSRLLGKTLTLAPETKTYLPDKEKHYKKLKEKID